MVEIYTTPTCGYCKTAMAYFEEKGIEYVAHDLAKNPEKIKDMQKVTKTLAVPVIVVGTKAMQGWDVKTFDELYGGGKEETGSGESGLTGETA